jgi:hypothetical protein
MVQMVRMSSARLLITLHPSYRVYPDRSICCKAQVLGLTSTSQVLNVVYWYLLELHDLAVTADGERVVAIATYGGWSNWMSSKKSRLEKRIFGEHCCGMHRN